MHASVCVCMRERELTAGYYYFMPFVCVCQQAGYYYSMLFDSSMYQLRFIIIMLMALGFLVVYGKFSLDIEMFHI